MTGDDRPWKDLTTAERLGLLKAVMEGHEPQEKIDRVMGRVASYFLGGAQWDFYDATNILMRELWRDEHDGDASAWDASCRASGNRVPTDPRADLAADRAALMAEKGKLKPHEFAGRLAELDEREAKLYAPTPMVVGKVIWSAALDVGNGLRPTRVVWTSGNGTPDVFVDDAKVNAKHRRRILRALAEVGVTRASVVAAEASGRASVAEV